MPLDGFVPNRALDGTLAPGCRLGGRQATSPSSEEWEQEDPKKHVRKAPHGFTNPNEYLEVIGDCSTTAQRPNITAVVAASFVL